MGRIKIAESDFHVAKAESGHITGGIQLNDDGDWVPALNKEFAIRGDPIWFIIEIDDVADYHAIKIKASYNFDRSNPNEVRHLSRVGIWTAVQDRPSIINESSRGDRFPHGLSEHFSILLDEWKFGQGSEIQLEVNASVPDSSVKLAICAMPFFMPSDEITSLNITLQGMKKGLFQYKKEPIDKIVINCALDEHAEKVSTHTILDLFREFNAFNLDGQGNSIHPKQLYTAMALNEQLIHRNEQVDVAYIGTDTTENLRSLIRRLKADESVNNIRNFYVYFTEEWDAPLVKKHPGLKLNSENSKLYDKLRLVQLPLDGTLPSEIPPVDYIISTYVTPWAISNERNKSQYVELLQELMAKNGSKLISVDPENDKSSIRSYCKFFNLQGTYEKMGLRPIDPDITTDSDVIECTIWEKKAEVGE